MLEASPGAIKNQQLIGIVSVLANILTSTIAGIELHPRARKFLAKVVDAFRQTYEVQTPDRTNWRKLQCMELLAYAYSQGNAAKRRSLINLTIRLVDEWKLHIPKRRKEARPVGSNEQNGLHLPAPAFHGVGKHSPIELALERSSLLFGQDFRSGYNRAVKRRDELERLEKYHYVNDIEAVNVAFVLLQHVLGIKGPLLVRILKLLWRENFQESKIPANNGNAACGFFEWKTKRTLKHLSMLEDRNHARTRLF